MGRKKGIIYNIMVVMLCAACLSGCGKADVEYENDSTESVTQEETMSDNSASGETGQDFDSPMAKRLNADKEWHTEWVCEEQNTIKVNAVVTLPEADAMQVLKVKQKVYTNEERKKIAEYLFDAGSIEPESYGDKYVTKEALAEAIEEKKQSIVEFQNYYSSEDNKIWDRVFDWQKVLEYKKSQLEFMENQYENFADVKLDDYSWGFYKGTRGGREYTLALEEQEYISLGEVMTYYDAYYTPALQFLPVAPTYQSATKDSVDFGAVGEKIGRGAKMCPVQGLEFGENKAAMTKEQAQEQACRICDDLNIEGMKVKSISDMGWWQYWDTDEINMQGYEAIACDGYVVTMERNINGGFVSDKSIGTQYGIHVEDWRPVIEPELLSLYLKDDGIVAITLSSRMEIVERMTDNTELLQFEQVKPLLEEAAMRKYNGFDDTLFFDNMELTYMCIGDVEDKETFYFVPIWQLYASIGNAIDAYDAKAYGIEPEVLYGVAINAIDGSEIDLERRVSVLELKKKFEEEQAE